MSLLECKLADVRVTRDVFTALKRHSADPIRLADLFEERFMGKGSHLRSLPENPDRGIVAMRRKAGNLSGFSLYCVEILRIDIVSPLRYKET